MTAPTPAAIYVVRLAHHGDETPVTIAVAATDEDMAQQIAESYAERSGIEGAFLLHGPVRLESVAGGYLGVACWATPS